MHRSVAIDAVTSRDLRYYRVTGDGLRLGEESGDSQTTLLVRDADGRTRVDEWLGGSERRDDARTDEECYRCLECGELLPAEPERNNHPTVLLRRITGIVNRRGWNLDTLAAIRDVLREGGFGIREAEEDITE
jgi:hypothetical protein